MKSRGLTIACVAAVVVLSCVQAYAAVPVLKVGMPLPLTGVVAESAKEMEQIFRMYLDETGGKLGGLPVQLIVEDTETQAEMVVTKTRKLIDADQVHLLTGGMLAFEALAMRDPAIKAKIAHVISISTADDLTQRLRSPYIIRVSISSSQETMPFGEYAYNVLGYRKVATVGQDYAWGWETVGGFQFAFEQLGGKVVQKLWAPIGTTDYAPFVTQLRGGSFDAVWATLIGADIPRFVQAYQAYGLKDKAPLIGSEDLVDQDVFRYYGDEALGIIGATPYNVNLDRPEMRKFVAAYQKRSGGKKPTFWGHGAYVSAMWIDRALQKLTKEGVAIQDLPQVVRNDALKFTAAIKAIEIPDAPAGPIRMTEYNNPIRNIYLVKVVKKEGKIDAVPIHTFPDTTQFWKIDPQKFLSQPVFSRDFPPLTK
jgi:branched-chain amino acid transport system substrate-binding protein